MLSDLCKELKNWFCVNRYIGTIRILNGKLTENVLSLQEGQYFRIVGSIFNDGVYKYPVNDLKDEVFRGAIWAMAVPNEVIDIAKEIKQWNKKYGDSISSPYSSESFGGYSYSKATTSDGNNVSWQSVFKKRLNKWRKL